jgi:hypothetical protein
MKLPSQLDEGKNPEDGKNVLYTVPQIYREADIETSEEQRNPQVYQCDTLEMEPNILFQFVGYRHFSSSGD